ncbi:hypothetical protein, unlikely [Trypanosoma brucei brucei TREU927]|uniref:Secreted protein n=1 Tax=Trypanosoma brucei brucei (strain 927/4 GUTat10.1) TaxID=185431 RepID=Q38FN0_TRYB2|nr:hypothetical protein, unlikely [Trypanosoma brucei brucei TREU927]EAN76390.1 hypothetical protein, unlikely [Trypanosoma brucei brucei TREU927]
MTIVLLCTLLSQLSSFVLRCIPLHRCFLFRFPHLRLVAHMGFKRYPTTVLSICFLSRCASTSLSLCICAHTSTGKRCTLFVPGAFIIFSSPVVLYLAQLQFSCVHLCWLQNVAAVSLRTHEGVVYFSASEQFALWMREEGN